MTHPIRNAELHVWGRVDLHEGGSKFVARFHPYHVYPVFFSGSTAGEVIAKANALRADAIAKHEASVIARQDAKAKADAARDAKKAKA